MWRCLYIENFLEADLNIDKIIILHYLITFWFDDLEAMEKRMKKVNI